MVEESSPVSNHGVVSMKCISIWKVQQLICLFIGKNYSMKTNFMLNFKVHAQLQGYWKVPIVPLEAQ